MPMKCRYFISFARNFLDFLFVRDCDIVCINAANRFLASYNALSVPKNEISLFLFKIDK